MTRHSVLQLGTVSAPFPAVFPTSIRYAGFAISYNIATSAFGGTEPFVNTAMTDLTGNRYFPAYMMTACLVGLIALAFMPETARRSPPPMTTPGPWPPSRQRHEHSRRTLTQLKAGQGQEEERAHG